MSVLLFLLVLSARLFAQQAPGNLVLVLPFENTSQQPSLDWISNSFPSILNQRLSSAGFSIVTREDRLYALDRLGLPAAIKPSHAMALRIAQEMDVDYVVYGSYSADGGQIQITGRVLDVRNLHLSTTLHEQDALTQLLQTENALAWDVIRTITPTYSVNRASFLAAAPQIRLDAFENFVRGVTAASPADRIKHFQAALTTSPDDVPTLYGLGRAYFDSQEYEQAAAMFARVPSDHALALQAAFYLGLSQFYSGKYADAEQSFAFVATRLPLPEVLNNQGVAASRHGKSGVALFQQAAAADPKDEDYHYNLAVALRRAHDFSGARHEIDQALALRPTDEEAKELSNLLRSTAVTGNPGNGEALGPLERLKRVFNITAIREASVAMAEMEQARLASQPPQQRSQALSQHGETYLSQGLTLEAEQAFQQSLAADPQNWQAHAGLAAVRARTASFADAVSEAKASVNLHPNAQAYLAMAQAQVAQKNMTAASASVSSALHLEPANAEAQRLKAALAARGVPTP